MSGQQACYDLALTSLRRRAAHPGPETSPSVAYGRSQQVQHGRVEIVDADRILDGGIAEFVGGAVGVPGLMPPPASMYENPLM